MGNDMTLNPLSTINADASPKVETSIVEKTVQLDKNGNQTTTISEEHVMEDLSVETLKKRKNLNRLLQNGGFRTILILGAIFAACLAWALVSLSSTTDKKVVTEKAGGAESPTIDMKNIDTTVLNEQQAEHIMKLKQEQAAELAKKGQTNAATIAISPTEIDKTTSTYVDENAKTTGVILNTNGLPKNAPRRTASPNENLNDTSRYTQIVENGRISYVEKATNTIVEPPPLSAQTNANGGSNTGSGANGGSNGGTNGSSNGGNGGNGGQAGTTNNNQEQKRQPDADIPRIEKSLSDSYQVYLDNQKNIQEQMQKEQEQRISEANSLEKTRQQAANSAINNALRRLNIGRSTQPSFGTSVYLPSTGVFSSGVTGFSVGTPTIPTNPYDSDIGGVTKSNSGNGNNGNVQLTANGLLPSNIIRAGTTWAVVIKNKVNTDNGSYVVGEIANGAFAGSEVYGTVEPTGRNIGISFTAIKPKSPRKPLIPISAIAMTIGGSGNVASKVNYHYAQNYGTMILTSAIGGYGSAYSTPKQTTTVSDGVVITTQDEATAKQVRANIYQQLAAQITQDMARFGSRPPTFIVNQGSVLQMTLINNMDTKAATDTLDMKIGGVGGQGGQGGSTRVRPSVQNMSN